MYSDEGNLLDLWEAGKINVAPLSFVKSSTQNIAFIAMGLLDVKC